MSDFHQWPWYMKVSFPLWFPLFLLVATLVYAAGFMWGTYKAARGRR